ncbi:MAG: hypothetical protein IJP38_02090 [Oscillospiraceae bacterium]|nr:hypothetical protein [Oscillospiraceae bacterium]
MSNKYLIGWSEVDMTPDKRIRLAGQFYERVSEYVETPITATAMAIASGDTHVIICSADLGSVGLKLVSNVRNIVAEKNPAINTDAIIIAATHTHTSFVYADRSDSASGSSLEILKKYMPEDCRYIDRVPTPDDVMKPQEASELIATSIAKACLEAFENMKPASFANEFGRAAVGMNRRVCYDDGSAKMWGDAKTVNFTHLEGGNDNGIELIYTFDEAGKLTGVVANIACPSQVVEQRSYISSDYWGKVKILLREKYGEDVKVLGLCGAGGDQCPRDLIRWVDPETPIDDPNVIRKDVTPRRADPSMYDIKGTWKIGKRIVNEISDVYDEIDRTISEGELVHKKFALELPLRRVTPAERDVAEKAIRTFFEENKGDINYIDTAAMHVHAGTLGRFEYQQTHNVCTVEIQIIKLGNIVFATNPYELFLDYGNQIRALSLAEQTFIVQLCNGSSGYLPTKKAEAGGHYSAYVSSGTVGHAGGEMLVRKTVDEINKLF